MVNKVPETVKDCAVDAEPWQVENVEKLLAATTVGTIGASLSVIVPIPVLSEIAAFTEFDRITLNVSELSKVPSSNIGTVMVWEAVEFAGNVKVFAVVV